MLATRYQPLPIPQLERPLSSARRPTPSRRPRAQRTPWQSVRIPQPHSRISRPPSTAARARELLTEREPRRMHQQQLSAAHPPLRSLLLFLASAPQDHRKQETRSFRQRTMSTSVSATAPRLRAAWEPQASPPLRLRRLLLPPSIQRFRPSPERAA